MFEKIVTKILRVMCFIMFLIMTITVFTEVILRYFLHSPIAWSDELSRLLLVWVSFLGVTLVHFSKNGHPAVKALIQQFSILTQNKINILINILLLVSFIFVFNASLDYTIANVHRVSPVLHYPNAVKYAVVPISMILMAIKSIFNIINGIKELHSPH